MQLFLSLTSLATNDRIVPRTFMIVGAVASVTRRSHKHTYSPPEQRLLRFDTNDLMLESMSATYSSVKNTFKQ